MPSGASAWRIGQPLADQVGGVAGTEEPQHAGEQPAVVLVPAHAGPGAERVHEPVVIGVAGRDRLERAGQEDRAVLVGEHHGLLRGQLEGAVGRVVGDIAAGRLVAEPLPYVPFGGAGARGQRGWRHGSGARGRHGTGKSVAVTDARAGGRTAHWRRHSFEGASR